MTRKVRQYIFWCLVVVFSAVAPLVVLYARGYRFDMAKGRFVATGAIFIKSAPSGAAISVNGVRRGVTAGPIQDALTKPGLVTNVLPGEYDVRVEKTGYKPWVKKLVVRAREVTEARNLYLFPENNTPRPLYFTPVDDALVSADGELAAAAAHAGATSWIALIDTDSRSARTVYTATSSPAARATLAVSATSVMTLHRFSSGIVTLIVESRRGTQSPEIGTLRMRDPFDYAAFSVTSLRGIAGGITFADERRALWRSKDHNLWSWEYAAGEAPQLVSASVWGVTVKNGKIITIESSPPLLIARSLTDFTPQQLALEPFEHAADTTLRVEIAQKLHIVLAAPQKDAEGTVWLINEDGSRSMLHEQAQAISLSPSGKQLLIQTTHELWVYYLDDILVQPARKRGQKTLIARIGTRIKEAWWHPVSSDYVLYVIPEGLFTIELDDRGIVRNNVQLVRDGTIRIEHVTETAIFMTMQDKLMRFGLTPDPQ